MQLAEGLFSNTVLWWIGAFYGLALFYALRMSPWRRLLEAEQWHVFLGSCVVLLVLWSMDARINDGLSFHLLGVTTITLMFGWSFGVIANSIALLGVTINGDNAWSAFALNALVLGVLPVTLTQVILVLVRSLLPKNFFIYVLVNGFLTAGLVMLVSGYVATGLLILSGGYSLVELKETFIPFFPLMAMPEAFLNGWIITVLVVYRPQWVYSFSDELYIKGK
ncbi:energy-coupling factor ABC transporter permease [Solemya velesiana gill symbiont]|uniref:Molecular chaperone DnaJ n=1 Tax=Solemya velesiana gill symbiont TaxID=1918948 RepID=A0A1T2KP60_9GAMM|nr:energy-coupling factor ABC transporter permease [Solemya velesiana gill symbiont]OOZ34496.1 molecular chaperone DnaJ [Solemya velesiana gill symbiont]